MLDAGERGGADVELEYFVPGARWKPAYDLHFASARGQLRVETAAVVEQATGEDWERASCCCRPRCRDAGSICPSC